MAAVEAQPHRLLDEPIGQSDDKASSAEQSIHQSLNSSLRSLPFDPDAQATVTDFLDFTEHLPSEMVRSLEQIAKLDQSYSDASSRVHNLTTQWGQRPDRTPDERPSSVQLRADISKQIDRLLSCRVLSHAEAERVLENVARHCNRAKVILSKLQVMHDNYSVVEAQKQNSGMAATTKSPQAGRTVQKLALRTGDDGQRIRPSNRRKRITVPGEVLAPYELVDYGTGTDDTSDSESSGSDAELPSTPNPRPPPRIKMASKSHRKPPAAHNRTPKVASAAPRPRRPPGSGRATSGLVPAGPPPRPPPENAVPGSTDAPWMQLTPFELARLRKRMKKNATWNPSDAMIARELATLGRGPEAYRQAKDTAEAEGRLFDEVVSTATADGTISIDMLNATALMMSNRGMRLNEAKKMKKEALAKQAAEEAEESAKKTAELVNVPLSKLVSATGGALAADAPKETPSQRSPPQSKPRQSSKRKRESEAAEAAETLANAEKAAAGVAAASKAPRSKRAKLQTPALPLNISSNPNADAVTETLAPPTTTTTSEGATSGSTTTAEGIDQGRTTPEGTVTEVIIPAEGNTTGGGMAGGGNSSGISTDGLSSVGGITPERGPSSGSVMTRSATPVPELTPPPQQPLEAPSAATPKAPTLSPTTPISSALNAVTTSTVPTKPPAEPPVQPPKRETRQEAAKKSQQQIQSNLPSPTVASVKQSSSRGATPRTTPAPEPAPTSRRPSSRGTAVQEPQQTLASDRGRRASTTRNTPGPAAEPKETKEPRQTKRRPPPGEVKTTSSGGSSAVGKRQRPPKRKAPRKSQGQQQPAAEPEMEEVDDEGNAIDPDEARYCLCNRVSFGTMIQCDNVEGCKQEWFHLECVGLSGIPARTTKWYCPECRVTLKIGQRGEVSARGVRM